MEREGEAGQVVDDGGNTASATGRDPLCDPLKSEKERWRHEGMREANTRLRTATTANTIVVGWA